MKWMEAAAQLAGFNEALVEPVPKKFVPNRSELRARKIGVKSAGRVRLRPRPLWRIGVDGLEMRHG